MKTYLSRMDVARLAGVSACMAAYWELTHRIIPTAKTAGGRLLYDEAQVREWIEQWKAQRAARRRRKKGR